MQSFNHSPTVSQRRLVLCFDGTGNKFQGDVSDTNIVKLFQMLDRRNPNQFHYYQRESFQTNPAAKASALSF